MDSQMSWAKDAVERVFWTVVELVVGAAMTALTAALTSAVSDGSVTLEELKGVVTIAWTAVAAALKAYLAKLVPGTISPASTARPGS